MGTLRVLNAMHRPEDLFDSVENDPVARLFVWVICGKAAVIARMPILRRDDEIEAPLQFICKRDDLVTMRYCQGAARHEIILKIDEDQRTFHKWTVMLSGRETSLRVFPRTIS